MKGIKSSLLRPELVKGTDMKATQAILVCALFRLWWDYAAYMGIVERLVLDKMPVKHAQWSAFDRSGDPSNWHICGLLRAPKCRCRNNSWSHPPFFDAFLVPASLLPHHVPRKWWSVGREPERIIGPKSAKFLHKHCKIIAGNSHFELYTWSDGEYRA